LLNALPELIQQLTAKAERRTKAETENAFLREPLSEMRSQVEEERREMKQPRTIPSVWTLPGSPVLSRAGGCGAVLEPAMTAPTTCPACGGVL
jgi:hypothetical protein